MTFALLTLLLTGPAPTATQMRVDLHKTGLTDWQMQHPKRDGGTYDGGFKVGVQVSGLQPDGGVMESEACTMSQVDYLVLKRILERSGGRCLKERLE